MEPDQLPSIDMKKQPRPRMWMEGTPEAQAKFIAELAAAKLEFGPVLRDRKGQYGNQPFWYATLGSLTAATEEPLAKHGIVVITGFTDSPVDPRRECLNFWVKGHGAGIIIERDFDPKIGQQQGERRTDPMKESGSVQTYITRYQYRSFFALDSEPDADEAPEQEQPPSRRPEPRRDAPRPEPRSQQAQEPKRPQNAPQAQQAPAATVPQNTAASAKPAPHDPPPSAVTPVTPKTEEPDDGEAPDHATLIAIKQLLEGTGKGMMLWNKWCVDAVGVPLAVMKQSRQRAQTFLEHLQTMALAAKAPGPVPPDATSSAGAPS